MAGTDFLMKIGMGLHVFSSVWEVKSSKNLAKLGNTLRQHEEKMKLTT